jgi:hypothetical protein
MPWFDCLSPPDDRLGRVLPLDLRLATNQSAAMFLTHVRAYPQGFGFGLTVLTREEPGIVCAEALRAARVDGVDPRGIYLHFGVEFADGRRADARTAWILGEERADEWLSLPKQVPPDPATEIIVNFGGHELAERRFTGDGWVWPLPPPGPLTLHCGWPAAGLPLQATEIDAARILAAAGEERPLWEATG